MGKIGLRQITQKLYNFVTRGFTKKYNSRIKSPLALPLEPQSAHHPQLYMLELRAAPSHHRFLKHSLLVQASLMKITRTAQ